VRRSSPEATAPQAEAGAPAAEAEKLQPTDATTGPKPRLVVRGFIMMGGLVIKP
jgi:hypothetical protein